MASLIKFKKMMKQCVSMTRIYYSHTLQTNAGLYTRGRTDHIVGYLMHWLI